MNPHRRIKRILAIAVMGLSTDAVLLWHWLPVPPVVEVLAALAAVLSFSYLYFG